MLERKHVAVARNGIVRIKTTGETIGEVRNFGGSYGWRPSPATWHGKWCAYREEAVEDVIRAYNERQPCEPAR